MIIEIDDHLSDAGNSDNIGLFAQTPELSIDGSRNSSPAQPLANDPGLVSESELSPTATGGSTMSKWMWIGLILLVVLGLWYFNPGGIFGTSAVPA